MTIYIVAVRLSSSTANDHQHIALLRWRNSADGSVSQSARADLVSWIRDEGGDARVQDGSGDVQVGVVDGNPPYLRTYADQRYSDNLLSLPRF